MIEIETTPAYDDWIADLRDEVALGAIAARLLRVSFGNFGDWKTVGDGVGELRIRVGPGYRVYYARKGLKLVILLGGGDKSTQESDIKRARRAWLNMEEK